jgi:N utilization substance protein A
MIRGAVREAGDRAKVAVFSRERDIDPVGACVGMKGTRVQSIIRELRGEKIDIVEFSDDPIAFVTNALSPAKVQRVAIVDDQDRVMEVVVEDKQLSLAIGKKGQNVRLAAKLTGWRIDIKSEEEKRREVEAQFEGLESGEGTEALEEGVEGAEALEAEADLQAPGVEPQAGEEAASGLEAAPEGEETAPGSAAAAEIDAASEVDEAAPEAEAAGDVAAAGAEQGASEDQAASPGDKLPE